MKKNKKTKKTFQDINMPDLPQNIMPIGERVLDDKNIYIHQKVYAQIHKFAADKTENEHGGILVGRVLNEMGKENTIIEGFIEAKYNTATQTSMTFTHDTWEHIHAEMEKRFKGKKIVGWIHTHPNFGIFLSENDKFIQENFFTDANQVAYVVDPIQKEEGFFFWVDGKLDRCPGFYLFDRNGVKLKNRERVLAESAPGFVPKSKSVVLPILMVITILVNFVFMLDQNAKMARMQEQLYNMQMLVNQGMFSQMMPFNITPSEPSEDSVVPPEGETQEVPAEGETPAENPEEQNETEHKEGEV